ncbi:interleukin-12 receptor subunit beta-2 [Oncorhynchus tshawytscha]|uniref:Fibronectin type-III domain-containing protein n=1 Tax=Oncorhynchus tshawytscha TaxID=74940 RepID=A0A8C8HKX6_ONCTS|nr:interleukin-12 receptor subunit beta-2 [Oncorhynchus tshawytscha]XP_024277499.1 interleukin-12 receptor subunit beta-2 [Oncorhynchus tshawytscha]
MQLTTGSEQPRGPMAYSPHGWWSILIGITLLCAIGSGRADKPCTASSSIGDLVLLGSSFQVFCTYQASCRASKSMHIDKKKMLKIQPYNSTTIFLNVTNISKNTTYTCLCEGEPEPCGLDIDTGYTPDLPENVTCVQKGPFGEVMCTWRRGRETHLTTTSELWVRAVFGNSTAGSVSYPGSGSRSDPGLVSANFPVSGSVQTEYSVWARSSNKLGSAVSTTLNFTLDHIVQPLPPAVSQVECWSLGCNVRVKRAQRAQLLEVQQRTAQGPGPWILHPHTAGSVWNQSIVSLQPYTKYEFQARVRLSHRRGIWSDWSQPVSNWTQEEAPAKALDVWYTTSNSPNSITLYWKRLSHTEARGKIRGYKVIVHDTLAGKSESNTSINNISGLSCSRCNVTVYALNSKGSSPPARVTIPLRAAQPPQNVMCRNHSNHSITISWRRPVTAGAASGTGDGAVSGYLLEWFPVGRQVEKLRWKRLGPNETHTVIRDNIKPFECYEGAVYALYEQAVGRAQFEDFYTLELVPSAGPSVHQPVVEGDKVTVSWSEVPQEYRRGCIINYTIYVKNSEGKDVGNYVCRASERSFTIRDLPPEYYRLWMTASTASGQGPRAGHSFIIKPQSLLSDSWLYTMVLVGITSFLVFFVLLCLYQVSSLRRRVSTLVHCLMPDIVPDPANSKWAQECAKEKGELTLHLYLSESSVSEEEEPDTVEVQELPEGSWSSWNPAQRTDISGTPEGAIHPSLHLLFMPQQIPATDPSTTAYFQSSYLKSFSQESGSSGQTQGSQGTDMTVDYISTHVLEGREEKEEEGLDVMGFFSCPQNPLSPFMNPLVSFGGKLTLDAVRIDCSEFLD